MKLLNLLFSFEGRVGRGQAWLAFAFYVAAVILMVAASFLIEPGSTLVAVQLVLGVPCLVSLVAVGIKRLHDRNKSGWWLLVFYAAPAALVLLTSLLDGGGEQSWAALIAGVLQYISLVILLWALVELGCVRGSIGGNRYGPDPLAPKPAVH